MRNFQEDIVKLEPGGFPQVTEMIDAGCANVGGIFYGMVGGVAENLFSRIGAGHEGLVQVPPSIQLIERRWYGAKMLATVRVSQIRRRLIGDAALYRIRDQLQGIDTSEIEAKEICVAECCQHGDLHCANVVFDDVGRPMLINFGDTGSSFAAIDPVTMELSTIFHSQAATLPMGWPLQDTLGKWP